MHGMTDSQEFARLVDRTMADVSRYALRRAPTAADAEDAVAETYAVAWRRRQSIPDEPSAVPWLFGVCRNVLANQRRSHGRWARLVHRVGGLRDTGAAPDPDTAADVDPIRRALGTLPDTDAELLRLLAWEQLSQAEAGVVLGMSENAVALRASRARRKLRAALDDRSGAVVDMKGRATERSDGAA
jgi:RNA polymerase sigma-70 factor (ECF subfamily)